MMSPSPRSQPNEPILWLKFYWILGYNTSLLELLIDFQANLGPKLC